MTTSQSPSSGIELIGISENAIQKIIRPDLRFTVTRYFAERWVSVLGLYPKGLTEPRRSAGQAAGRSALLITDLRQFVIWNNGKPAHISQHKLAERHHSSERTIRTLLSEPLVKWFIKPVSGKYYSRKGKTLRSPNQYIVRQDEPLIPQDIEYLLFVFGQKLAETPSVTPEALLLWTLEQPRDALLAPDPNVALQNPGLFSKGSLNVEDIVQKIFPQVLLNQEEKVLASRVENILISPNSVLGDSKYFRENWMPQLGAGAGWLLFLLRNKGYLNEKKEIERNRIRIPDISKYAKTIGVSNPQILHWIKNDLRDWVEILSEKKGADQKIERVLLVNLHNRLTPDDEERVRQKVAGTPKGVLGKVAATPKGVSRKVAATSSRVPRKVAGIQRLSLKTPKPTQTLPQQQSLPSPENRTAFVVGDEKFKKQNSSLSPKIKNGLAEIGWADSLNEIEKTHQKNPLLVSSWLDYTKNVPAKEIRKSRAALFRHGIRTGNLPPKLHKPKKFEEFLNNDNDAEELHEEEIFPNTDPKLMRSWEMVLSQLENEMSRASFDAYLRDTYPISFENKVLKIQAKNAAMRDWLENRLKSKVKKLLIGIFNDFVEVEFISEAK